VLHFEDGVDQLENTRRTASMSGMLNTVVQEDDWDEAEA